MYVSYADTDTETLVIKEVTTQWWAEAAADPEREQKWKSEGGSGNRHEWESDIILYLKKKKKGFRCGGFFF